MISEQLLEEAESAVIDAAFAFLRWADTQASDLTVLPAEALVLLDRTASLGRAYDPHEAG